MGGELEGRVGVNGDWGCDRGRGKGGDMRGKREVRGWVVTILKDVKKNV